MKKISHIILTLVVSLVFASTVSAMRGNMMHDDPDEANGFHYRSFKIADLDLDETPEVILLEGGSLMVLDNQGNVLFTKEVEGINDEDHHDDDHHHHWSTQGKQSLNPKHMWWWDNPDDNYYHSMMNGAAIEVANMDDDPTPEIVILDSEKLIVLDNNGNPEFTITLPDINVH